MTMIDLKVTGPDLKGDEINGTGNVYYDVIWFVKECMTANRRLIGFIKDAQTQGPAELIALFEEAKNNNEESCKKAQAMLKKIL